ncbi:MAG: zinc-dependent alcohol dehydrogenase family protein [Candidatus Atribacteria bacterium]|nr:zinc-dependent alcohol dehydrogenase family protein [Candidatus Atribacteria bacterium]
MRAMVLDQPAPVEQNPLRFRDISTRKPGRNELLLQVLACGVCHTDLHIVEGELPTHKLPVVPGHQIIGKVEEAGELEFQKGQRVGVPWLHTSCGRCEYCQRGEENLCENARFTGYDVDGGYAEYVTVDCRAAYPLPEGYRDDQLAPLLCGGVIGYRAYRLSGVQKGEVLGLYGFGSSAHLVLQMALWEGVEVFVMTRSPEHQRLARSLGASFSGSSENRLPCPLHAAIIFAPAGELVLRALAVLRRGGRVITAGIYSSPIPSMDYRFLYQEHKVQSVTNSTRDDVRGVLALASHAHFQVETELFPLSEANRVLQLLKTSKVRASAVLQPTEMMS